MNIKKVSVSFEATINLGSYENMKPGVVFEAEIGPDEDAMEAAAKLSEMARQTLAAGLSDLLYERLEKFPPYAAKVKQSAEYRFMLCLDCTSSAKIDETINIYQQEQAKTPDETC